MEKAIEEGQKKVKKKIGWIRLGLKRLAQAVSEIQSWQQLIAFVMGLFYKAFIVWAMIQTGSITITELLKAYLRI